MLSNMEAEALSEAVIVALCRLQYLGQAKLAGLRSQSSQATSEP
jgi:hypothetical protein